MNEPKSLYKKIKQPKELKRWRPSIAFINAIELCLNTFGGECDYERSKVCRKALNLYCRDQFEFTPTDKKFEAKERKKIKSNEKAPNSINLEINHNILYAENKLGIKISDADLEGIVIAWINYKIKTKPVRKKAEYTFDYSY